MKKYLAIALVLILCLSLTACSLTSVDGYYETPNGEGGIKFTKTGLSEGTFVMYEDGEPYDVNEYKRNMNTWELDGTVLCLTLDGEYDRYCKVYGDCLILIEDEDDDPEYREYIAPKGNRFRYEIDDYVFYKDGTYGFSWDYGDTRGDYYREDNVIYMKSYSSDDYRAAYYIYDGDHIIDADYVLVKDRFSLDDLNPMQWIESLLEEL